jgi:hypothetical protein
LRHKLRQSLLFLQFNITKRYANPVFIFFTRRAEAHFNTNFNRNGQGIVGTVPGTKNNKPQCKISKHRYWVTAHKGHAKRADIQDNCLSFGAAQPPGYPDLDAKPYTKLPN